MLSGIEPMLPSESRISRSDLPTLVQILERTAAKLEGGLAPATHDVLEAHMRVLNSYYSNLIEGNKTHPREIIAAMAGDYSTDSAKRNLQIESIAHIRVQELQKDHPPAVDDVFSVDRFLQIHKQFYDQLPLSLRMVKNEKTGREEEVVPGTFRQADQRVGVGIHLAPEPEEISGLLARFSEAYNLRYLHGEKRVIAAMASHHRYLYIHPHLDGNGRVARLHIDLLLKCIGLGGAGVWCLSRGLARQADLYKAALADADKPREGDTDGCGSLTERGLVAFCEFMVKTAIDQVNFIGDLIHLSGMSERIKAYVRARNDGLVKGVGKIKPEAARLIERAFMLGEFPRSEAYELIGTGERSTRMLVQQLKKEGLLTETSTRSPLRWAIPLHAERYYFPELSP